MTFKDRVHSVVRKIPKGQVLTYKQVAQRSGNVKAVRAVGSILRRNYDISIPCHRVIRSDGKPGMYNRGGTDEKVRLLRKEGYLNL